MYLLKMIEREILKSGSRDGDIGCETFLCESQNSLKANNMDALESFGLRLVST